MRRAAAGCVLSAVLLLLRSPSAAELPPKLQDGGLRIVPRARYWRPSLSGAIEITAGGWPGSASRIDVADDLKLGSADTSKGGLELLLGNHRPGVLYEPTSFHGDTTLSAG